MITTCVLCDLSSLLSLSPDHRNVNRRWWKQLVRNNTALRIYNQWRTLQIQQDWIEWQQCLSENDREKERCMPLLNERIEKYRMSAVPHDIRQNHRYQIEALQFIDRLQNTLEASRRRISLNPKSQLDFIRLFQLVQDGEYKVKILKFLTRSAIKEHAEIMLTECETMISDVNKFQIIQLIPRRLLAQNASEVLRLLLRMNSDHAKIMGVRLLSRKKLSENADLLFELTSTIEEDHDKWAIIRLLPSKVRDQYAGKIIEMLSHMRDDNDILNFMELLSLRKRDEQIRKLTWFISYRIKSGYLKVKAMKLFSRAVIDKHSDLVLRVVASTKSD